LASRKKASRAKQRLCYDLSMPITAQSTQLFHRVIEPETGSMPVDLARYVKSLDFRPADPDRYEQLAAKARNAELSTEEADELDGFLHVDSLIGILRLKAERSLRSAS
jgi:hypothetical protein